MTLKLQSLPDGEEIHVHWVGDYGRYEGEEAMILENSFALHKLVVAMINAEIDSYDKFVEAAKALIYD